MKSKSPIPTNEQENVLFMFWQLLTSLEHRLEGLDPRDTIDCLNVKGAYDLLNRIGYTNERPDWETKKSKTLKTMQKKARESALPSAPIFHSSAGCGRGESMNSCTRGGSFSRGC